MTETKPAPLPPAEGELQRLKKDHVAQAQDLAKAQERIAELEAENVELKKAAAAAHEDRPLTSRERRARHWE